VGLANETMQTELELKKGKIQLSVKEKNNLLAETNVAQTAKSNLKRKRASRECSAENETSQVEYSNISPEARTNKDDPDVISTPAPTKSVPNAMPTPVAPVESKTRKSFFW
jgi:hypothetical protein